MTPTCPSPVMACPPPPSHSIKPGRRRHSNLSALIILLIGFMMLGYAQAATIHYRELPEALEALIARQDPLGGGSAAATSGAATATTTTVTSSKPSATHGSNSKHGSSTTASAAATSTGSGPTLTGLPVPFDALIGNNFTNTACPQFLENLNSNPSYTTCLPFSLIMQSSSFFDDAMYPSLLDQILDQTCKITQPSCATLMSELASQLKSSAVCGEDYSQRNPFVINTYNGLIGYLPLYQATCLKGTDTTASTNNVTSDYCYTLATIHPKTPVNTYIYKLPLGIPLPLGDIDCSTCLQQTMGFFASAATNATSPLSSLYAPAAKQLNSQCGANWVQADITVDSSTVSAASARQSHVGLSALVTVLLALVVL